MDFLGSRQEAFLEGHRLVLQEEEDLPEEDLVRPVMLQIPKSFTNLISQLDLRHRPDFLQRLVSRECIRLILGFES